jgi:iron complex outermembrane recepter protein
MNKHNDAPIQSRSLALAIAMLCTIGSAPSLAQDQKPAAETAGLDEIVVSARFREEKLQETPIAITAISAEDIQQKSITTASEIGYTVPNASFRPAQAAFGNTMTAYIRGIGQYDFLPEFEPGVGIYFDDVLHPVAMGSMIDLLDLERVEVLRGPQGTLFGRGAIGGAIRFVSRQPQGDDSGTISVTGGSFDRLDVRGTYDIGFGDDWAARITGVSKKREGHQKVYDFACRNPAQAGRLVSNIPNRAKSCQTGTQGGEDVTGARLSVRFAPNDGEKFAMTFSGDYMDDSSEARADTLIRVAPTPGGPFATWNNNYLIPNYGIPYDNRFVPNSIYESYATYDDRRSGLKFEPTTSLRQAGVSGKIEFAITDTIGLEVIGSGRSFRSTFATDADGSPFNEQTVDGRQEFDSKTIEIRVNGGFGEKFDWTTGYFMYDGKFLSAQTVSIPAFIYAGVYPGQVAAVTAANPTWTADQIAAEATRLASGVIEGPARFLVNGRNVTSSTNNSVYLHTNFRATEKLSFSLGGRYSLDDKREKFDNTIVVTQFPLPGTDSEVSHSDWKAGVDFKVTDNFMLYGSASTGYRPQAFNPRPFQATQFVQVAGEEATAYEVGFKSDLFDNRLRANFAAFYIDYSERITPLGGTECTLSNPMGPPPYVYNTVPAGTPGAVTDSLGNICLATTSRTFYQNSPGKVKGAEIEIAAEPVEGLRIDASYGLTKFDAPEIAGLLNNDRPVFVPEDNWAFGVQYQKSFAGGSTITPRADLFGQTEICSQATTVTSCAPGYNLVNVRVEWASPEKAWTVAVGATNVTDKEYFLNIFDLSAFGQPTTEGQPGRPRELYLQLVRNFK